MSKPKIVLVKELNPRRAPPPSEDQWVFLEMHGELGSAPKQKTVAEILVKKAVGPAAAQPISAQKESKGFFGWLRGIFGR